MKKKYTVFISYAWTNSEHESKVTKLCERLMHDGIEVIYDKWYLTPGNDKYLFMEKYINDKNVDKVLLICNKEYEYKANARIGGVGIETNIILQGFYNSKNKTKFIPVIFEKDHNNTPYVPTYAKSRIYIDLSNDEIYEKGYKELLCAIYQTTLYKKPIRGLKPHKL